MRALTVFFSLVGNNAAQETVAFLGDALTLVHLYFGCAVDESFWSFDLVVIGCCSQTVEAERVVMSDGRSVFCFVVLRQEAFLTDDVVALGAPVSGSTEEVSDDGEFEIWHWRCEHDLGRCV